MSFDIVQWIKTNTSNSHYEDGAHGGARHSVRAVRSHSSKDRRARSDAPYQPYKMGLPRNLFARIAPIVNIRLTGIGARPLGEWHVVNV